MPCGCDECNGNYPELEMPCDAIDPSGSLLCGLDDGHDGECGNWNWLG